MHNMPLNIGTIHFVGIGGIGMSGIAEVMHAHGYDVQGSDIADSANVKRLEKLGIRVLSGHHKDHIFTGAGDLPAVVVMSSAVSMDNPEVAAARQQRVPVVRRAEMLAELMRLKKVIAIGGTHGKTTTTSMVGEMLEATGFDPTVINGGIVNAYGTNTRMGKSDWMVAEADESDGTFTRLPATVAVVTNIDPEHLDHYGSFEKVRAAYRDFVQNLPFYGYAVLCLDHPEVQKLVASITDRKVVTYGFNPQADIRAVNLRVTEDGTFFDLERSEWLLEEGCEPVVKNVALPMPGRHNVQNALVALAIGTQMGAGDEQLKAGLASFSGVKRRFSKTGTAGGITVIDDYAHHPAEIETVLATARAVVQGSERKIIAVMQPHRFTRLRDLFDGFCTCFNEADTVIITDVYTAGEKPIEGFDKAALAEGIKASGHRNVIALPEKDDLAPLIAEQCESGDYVVCMGAGDITATAHSLPAQLADILPKKAAA